MLEALGVAVDLGPEGVARCVEEVGMGFMYAPRYHPSMKAVAPVRKALKVRTAFNLLGPMLNPARSKYALVVGERRGYRLSSGALTIIFSSFSKTSRTQVFLLIF